MSDNQDAMRSVHERLERESRDESGMISQPPDERYLTCALLAWHQLGHKHVDSLCKFIEENHNKSTRKTSENSINVENDNKTYCGSAKSMSSADHNCLENIKDVDSTSFDTNTLIGPVVKLPVETKMVMRLENTPCSRHNAKKPQKTQNDVTHKIDAACCMDSACMQRLSELDVAVKELRSRAAKLARREAERVELLERAEAAWKDLELGYQRRLSLAEEKEDDIVKQIKKTIEERNSYKSACTNMAETLKERADAAEKERSRLKVLEKEVCDRACDRLRLSEESAKGDAALAEQLCRATQLDRDLQFKEEQARRKVLSLESEVDSTRCLTLEAERAMRFELSTLKEQVTEVSSKLLTEEDINNSTKTELEQLRQEKADILEDLDGCKVMCDSRMQGQIDELNQKREQLKVLKEKVIECRCKLPLDVAVEVKRTPSLAALCRCTPEEKLLESCSCTSLRRQLLSNLLADLFGGLQAELCGSGSLMPCGLLLCLDDRHNWDRASTVKTNLNNFFAQLLVGELDIAIATSIEKYHAKWVGASCADEGRLIPDSGKAEPEDWEQRAIEQKAQKLATQLAEQLFEERAEELLRKAKRIVSSGPPPCECKRQQPTVLPCLVKSPITTTARKSTDVAPSYFKRAMQDVTQLKLQIEDLKKETIKREDLRQMEEKIAKIIQRTTKIDKSATTSKNVKCIKDIQDKSKSYDENSSKNNGVTAIAKRKEYENSKKIKSSNYPAERIEKNSNKMFKKIEQSFAVNLCLCSAQEAPNKPKQAIQRNDNLKPLWKQKNSRDIIKHGPVNQSKPISTLAIKERNNHNNQAIQLSSKTICPSDCICFHKIPSNTSIDELLETLTKWNSSLNKIPADTKFFDTKTKNEKPPKNITISLTSALVNSENTKKGHDLSSEAKYLTADSNQFCENALPLTKESEYIGTINLDKSNYTICAPHNNDTKTECGDINNTSINLPLNCIKANVCECKSATYSNINPEEQRVYEYVPSNIKKISQIYPVEIDTPQFNSAETETDPDRNISKKNIEINSENFNKDVVRKSQIFSKNCDCFLKFLGVTLVNTNSVKKTKQINGYDSNALKMSSYSSKNEDKNKMQEAPLKVNKHHKDMSKLSYIGSKNKEIFNNLNYVYQHNKIPCEEEVCVSCCNQENISKDLELNAFNLLEDYLKGKSEEYQHFSCMPPEEEKKLFSTILLKVKEVISESTKGIRCICCDIDTDKEACWSRAYGMLQEYLKVKIKRIQCSCLTSEGNIESILPAILEKVYNLIENDFQRLKEKYDNNDKNCDHNKLNKIPFSKKSFILTDSKDERSTKSDANILFKTPVDKLCEIADNVYKDLGTSEKKVSCEFQIYGTDCNCQNKFTEVNYLDKKFIVNQCNELISTINNKTNNNVSRNAVETISSLLIQELIPSKETNKEDICLGDYVETKPEIQANMPYIGYTLSCKSLVASEKNKINNIWKSLTYDICPKNCSYIMQRVTNEKLQLNINNNVTNLHLSNLQPINCDRKIIYDIDVGTTDNNEDIVLKYSNEKCNKTMNNMSSFGEISVVTKNTSNDDSCDWYKCGPQQFNDHYQTDSVFDKSFLFDSLHLPTATDNVTKPVVNEHLVDNNDRSELESEQCDCKMVPICHVKMLVKNIEKKLVQLKCTCDSLTPQVCPVHSRGEFYVH